jgi:leader peptidase (prepilin peptidase) / N-methyltransferase
LFTAQILSTVCLLMLALEAYLDIKKKKIALIYIAITFIFSLGCILATKDYAIFERLSGMFAGGLLCVMGKFSGGKIGEGDCIIITLLLFIIGISKGMLLVFISLILAVFYSVFLLLFKHASKEDRIAYVPFLFFGYVLSLFM